MHFTEFLEFHRLKVAPLYLSHLEYSQQVVKEAKKPRQNIIWFPPLDFLKLNFDGSKLQDGSTAYGFVIRDVVGNLLLSGANAIADNNSILVAEAWGLREGIRGALYLGAKNIIIEGDNLSVIQAIKRVWKIPWSINALINDAADDLRKFDLENSLGSIKLSINLGLLQIRFIHDKISCKRT